MATTGGVTKSEAASGAIVATHTISEDAVTKHIQRVSIADVDGQDLGAGDTATLAKVNADTTPTGKTGLAANANRRGFLMQNISSTTTIEWRYGGSVTAGTAFLLLPLQYLERAGIGVCKDEVRVITASGTADLIVAEW